MKKKSKSYKKDIVKHLRSDMKMFKEEVNDDKKLIKKLSPKKKATPKKKRVVKKKASSKKKEKPGHEKFEQVLKEYKEGKLHSGSKKGPKVKKLSQALAIGYNEDRKADGTAKKSKRRRKK